MNPKDCLYCQLNAFTRQFNRMCERVFEEQCGMSLPHGNLLLLVLEKPGIVSKQLSQELVLANSTITRFVDALQKRQLVLREVAKEDARAFRIFPTENAKQLEPQLRQARQKVQKCMQDRFSSQQLEELSGLMTRSLNQLGVG